MAGFAGAAMADLRFLAPHFPLVDWDEAESDRRASAIRFQFTGRVPQIETVPARRIDAGRFAKDWPEIVQSLVVPRVRAGLARWAA